MFDSESKLMQIGNKFADLLLLNALTVLFGLPVFTIGASLTAMHYVILKIYRDEDAYIFKDFWKSFKMNFQQSTLITLIYAGIAIVLAIDFYTVIKGGFRLGRYFICVLGLIAFFYLISMVWVFVIQSRYTYHIRNTMRFSIAVGVRYLGYSVMMILMSAVPVFCFLTMPGMVPFVLLMGLTIPGMIQAILYSRVFDRLEGADRSRAQEEEDNWTVEMPEEDQYTEDQHIIEK